MIIEKVKGRRYWDDKSGQLKTRSFSDLMWADKNLPKLQSQEQKILIVFNSIIDNNEGLQLKDPKFTLGTKNDNLLRRIIGERTGTKDRQTIAQALENHPKMKQKKFRKIFDYMAKAHVNDFEGFKLSIILQIKLTIS